MPPARKRRKVEPMPRIKQYLDLTSETAQSEYDHQQALDLMLKAIRSRRKIVVVAGAGISTSAGIPDFRSAHGLFRSLRGEHKLKGSGKELFDASVYKDDSSTSNFHDMVCRLAKMSETAMPTAFHRLLARLSVEGRLLRLYTQNVDGLETSLPPLATQVPLNHKAPWPQTIQLHGGIEKMMCQKCRHISDFQAQLFAGPTPAPCPECLAHDTLRTSHAGKRSHGVGRLRPRIVLYNEHNPDDEAIGAVITADMRTRPDAVIVVGTSLKIPGVRRIVREMCGIVRDRKRGTTIWINHDSEPLGKDLDNAWDLVVKGGSDDVARLVNLKEWDDTRSDIVEEYTESEVERIKSSQGEVSVLIRSTPVKTQAADETAVMTPPLSQNGDMTVEPVSFKLGKTVSGSSLKNTHSLESKQKNVAVKNPASGGRSISAVLGKENKVKTNIQAIAKHDKSSKRSTEKKSLLKSATTAKTQQPLFKLSKPNIVTQSVKHKVVIPLSPRMNDNPTAPLQSNQYSSFESTPAPESPRWSERNSRETVSPTGSISKDMEKILN